MSDSFRVVAIVKGLLGNAFPDEMVFTDTTAKSVNLQVKTNGVKIPEGLEVELVTVLKGSEYTLTIYPPEYIEVTIAN